MSVLLGPPGTVPVRQYLRNLGYADSDIGWDQTSQQVLLQGSPLLRPSVNINGTTFAPQADLDAALRSRQTMTVNPRNKLMALLDQLERQINQPINMDFTNHPLYQQAMQAAQAGAQGASRNALEMLNARGILNSDQSASTVSQIQQQALQQAQANITPTILNAMLQERQLGMQGLMSGIEAYMGMEGLDLQSKQLALQQQVEQLNAAIARTNLSGRVSDYDAQILGIPAGTPSWQAQNAIASRQHELDMLQKQLDEQRYQFNQSYALDQQRVLLDIWKFTGVAPKGLEKFGVAEGTQYNETDYANLLRKFEYDTLMKDQAEYEKMKAALPDIQRQFGVSEATAEAIYGIWENPTREAALADWNSNTGQQVMKELGADAAAVKRAIDAKWPKPSEERKTFKESVEELGQNVGKPAGLAALLALILLGRRALRIPPSPPR